VRFALAIRRPEPCQGNGRSRQRAHALRPLVLPQVGVVAVTDLFGGQLRPQEIDVPGRPSAADIHVETLLELQAAKLGDADRHSLARCERKRVGSRPGLNHGFAAGTTLMLLPLFVPRPVFSGERTMWVWMGSLVFVLFLVVWYGVLPRIPGLSRFT
jgi:hypothetical protein